MPDATTNHEHQLNEALSQILDVSRQIALTQDLNQLLTLVVEAARNVLDADRGSVFLYDESNEELYLLTGTGLESLRISVDVGLAGECAKKRNLLNIGDCQCDKRFNSEVDKQTGYTTKTMIVMPLVGLDDELIGVLQVINAEKGYFDNNDENIAATFASQAAVAIQRAELLEQQKQKLKMERDLDVARSIQQDLLLNDTPNCTDYDIAVFNEPADETGGDIYDVVQCLYEDNASEKTAPVYILLADATGHGIGPAISVTQVRAMFRIGLRLTQDLGQLVYQIDRQLSQDLTHGRFITAFFGCLDPGNHRIEYLSPGQGPLLQYHAAKDEFECRHATKPPLGIMPMDDHECEPFDLKESDIIALMTDGFYERLSPDDDEFGRKRIERIIRREKKSSSQQIINALLEELNQHAAGKPATDDLTAVIIRRLK